MKSILSHQILHICYHKFHQVISHSNCEIWQQYNRMKYTIYACLFIHEVIYSHRYTITKNTYENIRKWRGYTTLWGTCALVRHLVAVLQMYMRVYTSYNDFQIISYAKVSQMKGIGAHYTYHIYCIYSLFEHCIHVYTTFLLIIKLRYTISLLMIFTL